MMYSSKNTFTYYPIRPITIIGLLMANGSSKERVGWGSSLFDLLGKVMLIVSFCIPAVCNTYGQANPQSGLQIGAESPAFGPQHAWGPDKGSGACPMCKYGYHPGIIFFLNSDDDWENTKQILLQLEEESVARQAKKFKVYLIYTNPAKRSAMYMDSLLSSLGKELRIRHVAITFVPSIYDRSTDMYKNKINPRTTNTLIVYNKRIVKGKFVNFVYTPANMKLLLKSVDQAAK